MDRRAFIAMSAAYAAAGTSAFAQVPLNALSNYFNGIKTLEARFSQTSSDGSKATGTLYMLRPGRARFEYDPPAESLVIAGGGQLAVFDGRSNSRTPEQYPLKRTPLYIVLEKNVDLRRRNMIVGHSGDAERTTLVAQDPESRESGQVELYFINNPLTLAGWTAIDAQGQRTRVQLQQIRLGGSLRARLFNIQQEIQSR